MPTASVRHWLISGWKHEKIDPSTVGWAALGVSILSASTYNAFAKDLSTTFAPLSLLFVSECLTALFILFSFGTLPTIRKICSLEARMFLPMLVVGLLSGTLGPLLWFTGLQYTTALNASLFGNADTLFLIALAALVLGEKVTREHAASAVFIGLGILVVVLGGAKGSGMSFSGGDVMILLGSLCFSTGSIVYRRYLRHQAPHLMLFMRALTALAVFFLLSPFLPHSFIEDIGSLKWNLVPILLGFAFISKFLCVFSFYEAIERLPVSTVSLMSSVSVIGGAIFAFFYNGEPLLWYHFIGGALLLMGTCLFEFLHSLDPSRITRHTKPHHPETAHPVEIRDARTLAATD